MTYTIGETLIFNGKKWFDDVLKSGMWLIDYLSVPFIVIHVVYIIVIHILLYFSYSSMSIWLLSYCGIGSKTPEII